MSQLIEKINRWVGKYHYVVWSGGLDSTYLLDRTAYYYSTSQQPIYALSFTYPNISKDKEKMEAKAREKFMKYAKKERYNIEQFSLNISDAPPMQRCGLCQAVIWAFLGLPFAWDNSVMHFGYVRGDDFWHYSNHFADIIHTFKKIKHTENFEVAYDLEYVHKSDLIGRLREDLYWYCEEPIRKRNKIIACGRCCCCVAHRMAEYRKEIAPKKDE